MPLLAWGIAQGEGDEFKIRQLVDGRLKNLYNSMPERIQLKGIRAIIEAIDLFQCPIGSEHYTASCAST